MYSRVNSRMPNDGINTLNWQSFGEGCREYLKAPSFYFYYSGFSAKIDHVEINVLIHLNSLPVIMLTHK